MEGIVMIVRALGAQRYQRDRVFESVSTRMDCCEDQGLEEDESEVEAERARVRTSRMDNG